MANKQYAVPAQSAGAGGSAELNESGTNQYAAAALTDINEQGAVYSPPPPPPVAQSGFVIVMS